MTSTSKLSAVPVRPSIDAGGWLLHVPSGGGIERISAARLTNALQRDQNLGDLTNLVLAWENLGLGTLAGQDAASIVVAGGSLNGVSIGATSPGTGAFTGLAAKTLALAPDPIVLTTGGAFLSGTGFKISGSMSGTSNTFPQPFAAIHLSETAANSSGLTGATIDALYVNHATMGGAGAASRNAVNAVLSINGLTGGTQGDGKQFFTALMGNCYVAAANSSGAAKGDFFGLGTIVTLKSAAGLCHGAIGGELDVAVEAGASVVEKVLLQLVTVNGDAVKGIVDAGLLICGDATTSAGLDYGIVFGKPGSKWNTTGTLIGTYGTTNARNAVKGIDFSAVTFTGNAIATPGFSVGATGVVTAAGQIITQSAAGGLRCFDAAAGTDGKYYDLFMGSGLLALRLISDDQGTGTSILSATRSGMTVTSLTLKGTSVIVDGALRLTPSTPASSGAAGTAGQISVDANYAYVCTGPNQWKRAALAAF